MHTDDEKSLANQKRAPKTSHQLSGVVIVDGEVVFMIGLAVRSLDVVGGSQRTANEKNRLQASSGQARSV